MTFEEFTDRLSTLERCAARLTARRPRLADAAPPAGAGDAEEAAAALGAAVEQLLAAQEELRVQEEELAASRDAVQRERLRYQALFEFAPDAYLVTDENGLIRDANRVAARLLGVPQRFLVGKALALYLDERQHLTFWARLRELRSHAQVEEWSFGIQPRASAGVEGGTTVDARVVVARGERGARELRWLLRARRSPDGAAGGFVVATRPAENAGSLALLPPRAADPTLRIFVVSSDRALRDRLARELGVYWTVDAFPSADAALAAARERRPDLALVSDALPDGGAPDLLAALRSDPVLRTVHAIVLTTGAPTENVPDTPRAEADGQLPSSARGEELGAYVGGRLDIAVARRELAARLALLADTGTLLSGPLDARRTLGAVAALVVPRFADWCGIDVVDEDSGLSVAAAAHAEAAEEKRAVDLARALDLAPDEPLGPGAVLRSRNTQFIPEVPADLAPTAPRFAGLVRGLKLRSYLCIPLVAGDRALGTITFATGGSGRRYDSDDRVLAEQLASRTAAALEQARAYDAERAARHAEARLRAEAEAANRAKSEFLAHMSHELRTPLNAIGGYVELLELGIRGPVTEAQREDLQRIKRSQRHLLALVNDALNLERIERRELHLAPSAFTAAELLHDAEQFVIPLSERKGIHFSCGKPTDLAVWADRERALQVLINLLSNAVKFTEPGGRVECVVEAAGPAVRVSVHDTGRGVPGAKMAAIFEPFVQVDATLTRAHDGAGLGLAISRNLARAMGGDLTVESAPGEGSTFTFSLPAVDLGL